MRGRSSRELRVEGLPPLRLVPGIDLVGVGGRLDPAAVHAAYRSGVFPWYDAGGPVLWWSPDPRALLPLPPDLHVSRRLRRTIRSGGWQVTGDAAFEAVMHGCNEGRPDGVWIHPEMIEVYTRMHDAGHAHSVEVWREDSLVGGIYGVSFGAGFAAESMFHRVRDASKVALVALALHLRACGYGLLDVQFRTPHLTRFGCREVSRAAYLQAVTSLATEEDRWRSVPADVLRGYAGSA